MNEDKLKAQLNYIESELAKVEPKYTRVFSNLSPEIPFSTSKIEWSPKKPKDIINDLSEVVNELQSQSECFKTRFVVGTEAEIQALKQLANSDFKPNLPDLH